MSEALCDEDLLPRRTSGSHPWRTPSERPNPSNLALVLVGFAAWFGVLAGFWMTFMVIQGEDASSGAVRSDFESLAFAPVSMPADSVKVTASPSRPKVSGL